MWENYLSFGYATYLNVREDGIVVFVWNDSSILAQSNNELLQKWEGEGVGKGGREGGREEMDESLNRLQV